MGTQIGIDAPDERST